jgi:hypothetical protein
MKKLLAFLLCLVASSAWADEKFSVYTSYQTVPLVGSTFTPNLALGANMILNLVHGSCPCTLANMTNIVPGRGGGMNTMRIVQSASGGETLALSGSTYALTANLGIVADAIAKNDWLYYIDADGMVQFIAAILPPTLSSLVANQLTGGDGMTSGWTASTGGSGATLTVGPQGIAPDGSNNSAFLTEFTNTGTHFADQNTTLTGDSTGTVTGSVFTKEKSGTRLVEIRFADNAFSNVASVTADPVACAITSTTGTIGTGFVSATGTINRPNGFCEVWYQATLAGATMVFENIQLSTLGGDNYAGDGTSALWLWRPAARRGAVSPP